MKWTIFHKKGNAKKRRRGHFSSEKMLVVTFVVSLALHLLLIYTIPAVDLFSEGMGTAAGQVIEVDFIAEDFSEVPQDLLQTDDNQFQAALPTPLEQAPQPEVQSPTPEIPDIPTLPEVDRPPEDFMLLADTLEREPEFSMGRKRPTPEPAVPVRRTPEVSKIEKQSIQPKPLSAEQERPEASPSPKPVITPDQAPQEQPLPEEPLQFPVSMPTFAMRSLPPEATAEPRIGFNSKRPALQPLTQGTPAPPTSSSTSPSTSRRRLVGLDKESIQDTNRFGIFAGEEFEQPQMKETIQEASLPQDSLPGPETEETEQARTLDLNTQIEGPLRGRAIVYKPAPPQLSDIENEVELRLKFWVLPDGTIGEVIPLKRGDAQLERIAIAYLKKWQFEALAPDAPQQKIWGTIPIVFTTQ